MHYAAKAWWDRLAAERPDLDLEKESGWKAAGVGFLGIVGVLVLAFGMAMFGPDWMQERVEMRPGAYVYYEEGATVDEARALGAALRTLGFFAGDHEVDVNYERTPSGHAVSLVVPEDAVTPELEDEFRTIVRALQTTTDPLGTLELRLCNEYWSAHHRYAAP